MTTLARRRELELDRDPRLEPIDEKVARGERLTLADGEVLFATRDLLGVIELADSVRRRLHGDAAYYNVNRHLNYSNVCALSCKFCEFYRKAGEEGAYTRDMAFVREEVRRAVDAGATEVHSVGGLHPTLPFAYYEDLVSTIRDEAARAGSSLHVKAFTAVEIVHLCRVARLWKGASLPGEGGREARRGAIREVLTRLRAAGLGSLPGGGAEVFDDRVHDEAYKGKIRSDVWLDVHRVAHELGINTNATMLYGHIESRHDRLVHMDMLRRAQDEALARLERWSSGRLAERARDGEPAAATLTRPGAVLPERQVFRSATSAAQARSTAPPGYYQTIIPLPFFPDGCDLEHLPGPSGLENYRTLAVSRLMLDNFPHVKAFWIMQTLPMAQVMLQSGADDLDGTVVWYDITKVPQGGTGAGTHQEVSPATLSRLIREAGFEPVERDSLYRRVAREGKAWRVHEADHPPCPSPGP